MYRVFYPITIKQTVETRKKSEQINAYIKHQPKSKKINLEKINMYIKTRKKTNMYKISLNQVHGIKTMNKNLSRKQCKYTG